MLAIDAATSCKRANFPDSYNVCWLGVLFLSGLDGHGLGKLALCEGPGGSFSVGALAVLSDWWVVITELGLGSSCSRVKCGNVALENPCLMTSGNNAQVDPQHHNWNVCVWVEKRGMWPKIGWKGATTVVFTRYYYEVELC